MRDHPVYHLIKARILKKQGDMAEAIKTLQIAMQLQGVKRTGTTRLIYTAHCFYSFFTGERDVAPW